MMTLPPIKYIPDPKGEFVGGEFVDDTDRHFYLHQVMASHSPTDYDFAYKVAVANAKDEARHNLLTALRNEERNLRFDTFSALGSFSEEAFKNVRENREVNGVKAPTDDPIKL